MTDTWMQAYPQSYCVSEAGGCSDHLRCRIMIHSDQIKPKKPFKFTNALVDLPQFLPLMKTYWDSTILLFSSMTALFRFSKKLNELKPMLRSLRKEHIGDITRKTKDAWLKLCACQTATLANPCSELMVEEAAAFDCWSFLSQLEEKILIQKAKLHWLHIGDGNNKQFHQAAMIREVRNSIREIKRRDGTTASNQEEIKTETVNHFSNFMTHQPVDFTRIAEEEISSLLGFECEETDKQLLRHHISAGEIKNVLFGMANDKSSGLDGYTNEFYRASWPIIGMDFVVAVQSFFEKSFLPKGVNSTILALILKKEEATTMGRLQTHIMLQCHL